MKFSVWCSIHEAEVVPQSGQQFNFFPISTVKYQMKRSGPTYEAPSKFALDVNSFFCTGGHGEHTFIVTVESDAGEKFSFVA